MSIFGIPDLKLSPLLGIFGFGGSGLNRAAIAGSKHLQFAFPASTTTEQDGDYTVVRFNASQTISVLNYALSGPDNNVDVFVVAGGGNVNGGNALARRISRFSQQCFGGLHVVEHIASCMASHAFGHKTAVGRNHGVVAKVTYHFSAVDSRAQSPAHAGVVQGMT